MRFLKGSSSLICLVLLVTGSFSVQAETLHETVHDALSQYPAVDAARAGVESAFYDHKDSRSGYFPKISMTGTGGRFYGDNATSRGLSVTRGSGYSYLWEGSVSATQMLFDGFETSNRVDAAGARMDSAEMSLADAEERVALRAVQAYLNVLRVQNGLSMLKAHEQRVDQYLARINTAVEEGAADEAMVQQGRDIRSILAGFIADYKGQLELAQADYIEMTGRLPEGALTTPDLPTGAILENVQEAVKFAKDVHPSLKSAAFESISAQHDVAAEKAQLYPDVDGELSYLKSDKEDIIGGEVVDAKAVVRLNWAFETGGGQLARIKKKTHEYKEAQARLYETERQVERNVRAAYAELQTANAKLKNQDNRVRLNEKLFDTYRVQFDGARISLLQLMQSHNQLFNTKLEHMNTRFRVLAAQYGVLSALGQLAPTFQVQEGVSHSVSDASEGHKNTL